MEVILEAITYLFAWAIYGTGERPRHPAIRLIVSLIAFGGSIIAVFNLLLPAQALRFPVVLTATWIFSGLIVLLGEYQLGSRRVSVAALLVTAVVVVLALAQAL